MGEYAPSASSSRITLTFLALSHLNGQPSRLRWKVTSCLIESSDDSKAAFSIDIGTEGLLRAKRDSRDALYAWV